MLSDERLQQLLRDAHALESFERGEASVPTVVTGRNYTRWIVAAAASVAVLAGAGVVLLQSVARSHRTTPPLIAHTDPAVNVPPVAQAATSSLLLAVYQNDSGKLSCVNWSADALKGRNISSLTAEELTRLGLTLACDPQAARILVVGLEGPTASLPSSDARAHLVAQCLSTTPPCASGEFNPKTCASAGCLDTEVKVRVESLALK